MLGACHDLTDYSFIHKSLSQSQLRNSSPKAIMQTCTCMPFFFVFGLAQWIDFG